ncbi:unnamed protein product [Merluccius merluccius]
MYVNMETLKGQTALFLAAAKGHVDIVKLLVTAGANMNIKNAWGLTPILSGDYLTRGLSELVSILVHICSIELRNNQEKTAIYLAAENGHQECLEILASAASDCTTPLMAATKTQSEECVEVLLKHGADPHVVCSNLWPQLAIHAAASLKNVK